MKTINTGKCFQGDVVVGNQTIYLNTTTGKGVDNVLKIMKPQIQYFIFFGKKLNGDVDSEDIEQDIYITMLEGMFKYKNTEKASLSTFLCQLIKNSLIDSFRKKKTRNKTVCIPCFEHIEQDFCDPINKIYLNNKINNYDDKWKNIILRIFINEESILSVSKDEGMTPWGLTRALRRKLR